MEDVDKNEFIKLANSELRFDNYLYGFSCVYPFFTCWLLLLLLAVYWVDQGYHLQTCKTLSLKYRKR